MQDKSKENYIQNQKCVAANLANSRSISLKTLCKAVVAGRVSLKVRLGEKVGTEGILGGNSTISSSAARGDEEEDVRNGKSSNSNGSRTDKDEVHEVTTVLVNVGSLRGGVEGNSAAAEGGRLSRSEGRGRSGEGSNEGTEELHFFVSTLCARCEGGRRST